MAGLFFRDDNVRVAVLEEKLSVYEDLSREMLSKLEAAVEKISESSQNISRILIRHEEKIERSAESHNTILKLVDINEQKRLEDREDARAELNKTNARVDTLSKFVWSMLGALTLAAAVAGYTSNFFGISLQAPSSQQSNER